MTPQPEERSAVAAPIDKLRLERAEGYDQYRIVQRSGNPQYAEFSVPVGGTRGDARVSIGYRRCFEFDEGNLPGQDYALVRAGGGQVVGIVADGVSRSFYGDLAAEYVATWLMDKLWGRPNGTPDVAEMERLLKKAEVRFAKSVKEHSIPKSLSPYLISALERRRDKGSQAVFAAFVLNVEQAELTLYQVGDVSVLVHTSGPEPEPVESPPEGRWSSAGASDLLLKKTCFRNVEGVVIKTDGVSKEWGRTLDGYALDVERFCLMAKARAQFDDISFVAVRLDVTPTATTSAAGSTAAASTQPAAGDARSEESPADAEPAPPEQPVSKEQTVPAVLTDEQRRTRKQEPPVSGSAAQPAPPATAEGVVDEISTDIDAPVVDQKEGDRKREGAEQKKAASSGARYPWRELGLFGTGILVGLAAGTAITLLAVFAVARFSNDSTAATPAAQHTPSPQPSPGAQATPATASPVVFVEARKTEQRTFLSAHRPPLPKLIGDNPSTSPGEVIAHISADDPGVERVVFVLAGKEEAAERGSDAGGHLSFFARLKGLAGPSPVKIRLLARDGKLLYEGQVTMSGRESKSLDNRDPFLGYYEISVTRSG